VVTRTDGDVESRFLMRAGEIEVSAAVLATVRTSGGRCGDAASPVPLGRGSGFGVVEAWRGALSHRVEVTDGVVTRLKVVDPSWFNWPALPQALTDTIVPDFPSRTKVST